MNGVRPRFTPAGFARRLLARAWFAWASESWSTLPTPDDSSPVHAAGPDPDRILLVGAGGAAGYGVVSHDVGLGGQLARAIASITGRGVDLELVVAGRLTARRAVAQVLAHSPSEADAVVVALGSVETMEGESAAVWRARLTVLLTVLEGWCAPENITVIGVFPPNSVAWFPPVYERAVASNALQLNRVTEEVTAALGANYMDFRPDPEPFVQAAGRSLYNDWALQLAPVIASTMRPSDAAKSTPAAREERDRDLAADAVPMDSDPRLDSITATARRLFGTESAALTIIGSEKQRIKSSSGIGTGTIDRKDAICNVTVQRSRALVIENLSSHPSYRRLPWVTGPEALRFYAGYPIESAEGHRVGALCVMDSHSRRFSRRDTELLRELAFQAQTLINAGAA